LENFLDGFIDRAKLPAGIGAFLAVASYFLYGHHLNAGVGLKLIVGTALISTLFVVFNEWPKFMCWLLGIGFVILVIYIKMEGY
jgi:hypothetical protein